MEAVDVVIISNAKDRSLRQVTEDSIVSLLQSETSVQFRVIVVESMHGINYDRPGVNTVYPRETFGYHSYLNLGRKIGHATYVCLCNNDLIFEQNWASEIIKAMKTQPDILSASPYCKHYHPRQGISANSGLLEGYQVAHRVAGWCIFQQRRIYEIINDLDESFIFWYADNDYSETIRYYKIRHALVTSSYVNHLVSRTLRTAMTEQHNQLTKHQRVLFERKWGRRRHFR